jgi:hypothetical protein
MPWKLLKGPGLSPQLFSVVRRDEAEVGKEREDGAAIGDGVGDAALLFLWWLSWRTRELALPEDRAVVGAHAERDQGLLPKPVGTPGRGRRSGRCPDRRDLQRTFRSVPKSTGRFTDSRTPEPPGRESRPLFGVAGWTCHEQRHGRRAHPHHSQPPGTLSDLGLGPG